MMSDLKLQLACFFGRVIYLLARSTKSGGTALPGLTALKMDKKIVEKLAQQLKFSIIICGTNGKTTTARIISSIFKSAPIKHIHNRAGSNLLRGIASTLINKRSTIFKNPKKVIGLWEVDEAVLPVAIKKLKPKVVLINNLFRDQLDRYGEIDTLAKKWKAALKDLPRTTTLILNADDPTVAWLGKNLKCQVFYFGLEDKSLGSKDLSHASDATVCPRCLMPLDYEICFVSHLGIYKCPKCGNIQSKKDINCTQVKFLKESYTQIFAKRLLNQYILKINLRGIYNIYNALAALAVSVNLKINSKKILRGFEDFNPAFGRFEKVKVNGKTLRILLVKNPAGFNQALKTITGLTKSQTFSCLIALNDLIADGRDVSWIWDVDFEKFKKFNNIEKLIISGIRAKDMALRIKYAMKQWDNETMGQLEKNFKKAIKNLLDCKSENLFILPTYTAMLKIRKVLNQMGLVHSTWRD